MKLSGVVCRSLQVVVPGCTCSNYKLMINDDMIQLLMCTTHYGMTCIGVWSLLGHK